MFCVFLKLSTLNHQQLIVRMVYTLIAILGEN